MANSVHPDQTAPIVAVWSGSALFASILKSSVMLGNYLQQTTSADDIFRCFFLGALRIKVAFAISSRLVYSVRTDIQWYKMSCADNAGSRDTHGYAGLSGSSFLAYSNRNEIP